MQNSKKVVKSRQKNSHHEVSGRLFLFPPPLSLSRCPFYYYIFLSRGKGEESWKNFSSPLPTLGAFRRSRGFCLGTKRGLGGFVSVLFVEVELSKSGCFPSLWWKQSVVFGKLLALCTSSVSVVEDFFSQGFFQPIQLAGVNSAAMCTRFVPASPSSSPHWIEWVDTAWQWNNIIKNTWAHE